MPTIAEDIRSGKLDAELDEIAAAVKERRAREARITAASLSPGDIVHFSNTIRPRYLVGLPATVVKVNRESVNVSTPDSPVYQRYRGVRAMRTPNSLIRELAVSA